MPLLPLGLFLFFLNVIIFFKLPFEDTGNKIRVDPGAEMWLIRYPSTGVAFKREPDQGFV